MASDSDGVVDCEQLLRDVDACLASGPTFEAAFETLTRHLNAYAERPLLLDASLASLAGPVLAQLQQGLLTPSWSAPEAAAVFYVLCKVRGEATLAKLLPNRVEDLEPVLRTLETGCAHASWESLYVLLLWLAQLVLIPFHLHTVQTRADMAGALVALGRCHLGSRGKPSDAAQLMLARLLTRPDLEAEHLRAFVSWAVAAVRDPGGHADMAPVLLTTLARVFATGARDRMLLVADAAFELCQWPTDSAAQSPAWRKGLVKMAQRVGVCFLAQRVAPWRYQRGHRTLLASVAPVAAASHPNEERDDDDDWDVPVQVDRVVHVLLCGLRDRDTVVRWSAAKGLGRITYRLPRAFADLVVETVMELCSPAEEEHAWHGSCLALAELARRGLLLPQRLDDAFPAVLEALRYDVRQGTRSVGSQVRDAACYVLWACARAYAPAVLAPCSSLLAGALLETASLDREINCRRAASAALQEHVGRVGLIAHGLDLVQITDYFQLGSLRSAYRNVAVRVCAYPEYSPWLLDSLLHRKLRHWDARVRIEAATLLGAVVSTCRDRVRDALPALRASCVAAEPEVRHGALLAFGHAIQALCAVEPLTPAQLHDAGTVVPELEAGRMFRGKGGELVRMAACELTRCLAEAGVELTLNAARITPHLGGRRDSGKTALKRHKEFLDDCLRNASAPLQEAASAALAPFCERYLSPLAPSVKAAVVGTYVELLRKDALSTDTRGAAHALGALPASMYADEESGASAIEALCGAVHDSVDAATRKGAVTALAGVLTRRGACGAQQRCIAAVLAALNDYALDERGDVGSWTREAAALRCGEFLRVLPWTRTQLDALASALLSIIAGRLDRLRRVALAALQLVLVAADGATHAKQLAALFPASAPSESVARKEEEEEEEGKEEKADGDREERFDDDGDMHGSVLWSACAACLALDAHSKSMLVALCTSAGMRAPDAGARAALLEYLFAQRTNEALLARLWDHLTGLLREHVRDERVLPHLLVCGDVVLRNGCFDHSHPSSASLSALRHAVVDALVQSSSIPLLCAGIDLGCALLRFAPDARPYMHAALLPFLAHSYPRVRQHAALQLHVQVLAYEELCASAVVRERFVSLLLSAQQPECGPVLAQVRAVLGIAALHPRPPATDDDEL